MKKTLSLLLVLAMVLSSFSFAFAAEAEKTPGEVLKDLGVLEGNAKGDLMLEDELSRQDMIVLLSRVLGQEDEAKAFKGEMSFKDVNDSFYKPYIAWAEANKLTNGVEEGKFGFGRAVTEQEVATLMLRALGYNDVEFKDVPAKAAELKLVDAKADLTVNCKRARMAEITLAALGTKMNGSDKTLAENLGIELPKPAKLEVVEVKADNLKEIKVVFNKAVDESVLDIDKYETDAGTIENAFVEDESVLVLSLAGKMTNKKAYKLAIKGIEEIAGNYDFTAKDNAIPEVVNVVALGTKAVKITMSEPIKTASASNFKLDGKTIYAGSPVLAGRDIIIRPYTTLSLGEHELTLSGIKDYNDFVALESKHAFEVVEDKEAPVVENVAGTLENVVVTFNEDVDPLTVNNKTIYWLDGGVKKYPSSNVQLAGNKFAFTFSTDKALPVYATTVYISGVKDYSGNEMKATEERIKASIDETRPEVVSAELQTDLKTIVVKFSKPVNKVENGEYSALNRKHYRVLDEKDNKLLINKIEEDGTSGKVFNIVLSSKLKEDKEYTLKIDGIQDNNKYPNTMVDYTETIAVGIASSPKVEKVAGTYTQTKDNNKNSITVLFTRSMNLATLVDPANYIVKIGGVVRPLSDVGGEVGILKNDGTLIEIVVEGENVKQITEIAVLGVEDVYGKKLSNYGEMQPVGTVNPELVADADGPVVAVKTDKIEVTFNQPIAEAKAEDFTITGYSVTKVTGLETKTLTLELNKDLPENVGEATLGIKVKGVLGGELTTTKAIADGIRPTWELAAEHISNVNDDVKITLTFGENIKIVDGAKAAAIKDITVKRVSDGKPMEITELTASTNTLAIEFKSDQDSAYEVTVKDESEWILDDNDNTVVGDTARTDVINVATKLVTAEAAKITNALTFEVADADKADAGKVTAAAVAAAQAKVSAGYTVTAKAEGTVTGTTLKVTFVVTKADTTIKAETEELTLTFTTK